MDFLAGLHPAVVHFPIALLILYTLFEVIGIFWKNKTFARIVTLILFLGILGTVAALLTGNSAEEAALALMERGINIPRQIITEHRDYANITLWYFLAVLVIRIYLMLRNNLTGKFRIILSILALIGCFFVYETGEHGAELVYEYGVGTELIE